MAGGRCWKSWVGLCKVKRVRCLEYDGHTRSDIPDQHGPAGR